MAVNTSPTKGRECSNEILKCNNGNSSQTGPTVYAATKLDPLHAQQNFHHSSQTGPVVYAAAKLDPLHVQQNFHQFQSNIAVCSSCPRRTSMLFINCHKWHVTTIIKLLWQGLSQQKIFDHRQSSRGLIFRNFMARPPNGDKSQALVNYTISRNLSIINPRIP